MQGEVFYLQSESKHLLHRTRIMKMILTNHSNRENFQLIYELRKTLTSKSLTDQ